jgi:hypothetical protein
MSRSMSLIVTEKTTCHLRCVLDDNVYRITDSDFKICEQKRSARTSQHGVKC